MARGGMASGWWRTTWCAARMSPPRCVIRSSSIRKECGFVASPLHISEASSFGLAAVMARKGIPALRGGLAALPVMPPALPRHPGIFSQAGQFAGLSP
jgi:hypothetical protein